MFLKIISTVRNESSRFRTIEFIHEIDHWVRNGHSIKLAPNETKTFDVTIRIDNPKLWSTLNPTLHKLETKVIDENGKVLDSELHRFGIRQINVSRAKGFELNGKPLELIGTNRHQDYPWVGPALSRQANYRDAKLIKESGHNIVRLSHYPQSEEFLDACDELGILTIPCIAGWQFLNKDPRFENQVRQDIQELILRDARHPCVAWFETSLNETYPDNKTAQSWADAAHSTILGKDVLLAGDARPGAPWDIAYNQWKDEDFSRPQDAMPDKPGYIREYGDYEFGGTQSSSRVTMGQGIEKLLGETWNHVWSVNHLRPQLPWTIGYGTWEMFDHNVPYGSGVSASGLCDLLRRQKPSYYFYKSQTVLEPYAKVVADWQPGTVTRKVVVFTNCDEAILTLNGKEIARAKPERHAATKYENAKPFDCSNTVNLMHPPIVFPAIKFQSGTLKVVALRAKEQAIDEIKTAGAPDHLKVWIEDQGIPIGRNDLAFVRAAVVDRAGTVCAKNSRKVHFVVSGAALAGERDVNCEMGVGSALIRSRFCKTKIFIAASSKGIAPGKTEIVVN